MWYIFNPVNRLYRIEVAAAANTSASNIYTACNLFCHYIYACDIFYMFYVVASSPSVHVCALCSLQNLLIRPLTLEFMYMLRQIVFGDEFLQVCIK